MSKLKQFVNCCLSNKKSQQKPQTTTDGKIITQSADSFGRVQNEKLQAKRCENKFN